MVMVYHPGRSARPNHHRHHVPPKPSPLLVELAIPALRRGRQYATLRLWLEALPEELIRVRPVLSIGYAGALMVRGEVEGVEARLLDAERWLDTSTGQGIPDGHLSPAEMVVVDEKEFLGLPSAIAMYRAGQALVLGDVAGTMTQARRALDLAVEDDHLGRGSPAALLGLACWTSGDLDAAQRWYADAMASLEKAGHLSDVIGCSIAVADIRLVQGHLRDAMSSYERGLQHASDQGAPPLRGAADMHVGMSQLLRERNDLDAAVQHLLTGKSWESMPAYPRTRTARCGTRAIRRAATGTCRTDRRRSPPTTGRTPPASPPLPFLRGVLARCPGPVSWVDESYSSHSSGEGGLRRFGGREKDWYVAERED